MRGDGPTKALVERPKVELVPFEPERAKKRDAEGDLVITYAQQVKDWPLLEQAVEQKLADQEQFVGWWNANVTPRLSNRRKAVADLRPVSAAEATQLTGITKQQVSKWTKRLSKPEQYRAELYGAAYRTAMGEAAENVRGTQGTGENEWYTPSEYIELARETLGEIDLDPATSAAAQEVVRATACFIPPAHDGLKLDWHGRVWLNPPYAQPLIADFVDKMVGEVTAGHVREAIMLTHNYTDTSWFHHAVGACAAICFTRGRIHFQKANGETGAPTQGQAFFYFGPNPSRFAERFRSIGFVLPE
jgi:ParB family chromosome partitioning protein